MTTPDIAQRVRQTLADELGFEVGAIKDGHDIKADLDADSLDEIQIVMAIEEAFGFDISEADAQLYFNTVGGVIGYVTARVSQPAKGSPPAS